MDVTMTPPESPKGAELDHPCKETCSGWKQGFERGVSESDSLIAEARREAVYAFIKSVLADAENRSDTEIPEVAVFNAFFKQSGPTIKEISKAREAGKKAGEG